MPRYLRPQKPPEIVLDEMNNRDDMFSIEKAARYVSLIPFIEDAHAFDSEEMPDCWCTDEQFLALGFGDYEEHAILLCNYFNYIDKAQNRNVTSYLILGKGHPEGYTTYVMRISNQSPDVEFWNAKTGECFYFDKRCSINKFLCFEVSRQFINRSSNDSVCQLKEIGCVVSDNNIFINIQEVADPSLIDLNMKNIDMYMPFLK